MTYWTEERLALLESLRQVKTQRQLRQHFRRTPEDIRQAVNYLIMREKLRSHTRIENGVKVTFYKPWFAQNCITTASAEAPKKKRKPRDSLTKNHELC